MIGENREVNGEEVIERVDSTQARTRVNECNRLLTTAEFQFGRRLTFRSRGRPQYAICGISVTEV